MKNEIVIARQKRKCRNGHEWVIERVHDNDPSDKISEFLGLKGLVFCQRTEGSLSCPVCGKMAIHSENLPVEETKGEYNE